jgi:hypothetical protein
LGDAKLLKSLGRSFNVGTTGMSAHRDFLTVPGSDFRRRLSGKLDLQLPKQEQLILLWLRITGQDDHPIVRRGQFDINHLHGGQFFEHDRRAITVSASSADKQFIAHSLHIACQ